jgi:BioD-like phosphotransacetylase family protein
MKKSKSKIVQVVVESYRGLIENVSVFTTEEKAAKYIRCLAQENGLLTYEGEQRMSTIPELIEWLSDRDSFNVDYDIRWFATEINKR